ncbi:MAG: 2-succinyl-6-hydroxy-2,4-cyclohexadiene-carboxylate synthase [Solirubrobacteraceae bacterium]|nr:2-succinyl-6-hydroxy-2,4-cyclohexadiene-carboxylate synthase [Solirubrobacteraceae bacterium]
MLLHGFAGTGAAWEAVIAFLDAERYRALTPDLPGHGSAAHVRPVDFASCVDHVAALAPERFELCGYSMGGRVALHVALAHPDRVTRLVLVATTAGIEDETQRAERRASDLALAAEVERGTIADFAAQWTAQPLFASDPPHLAAGWRADLMRNDPRSLAEVLRGIGSGSMTPLWDRLGQLSMPVLVVVGERDVRYRAIAGQMVAALPRARLVVVPGAGHGLPREAPAALAESLQASG